MKKTIILILLIAVMGTLLTGCMGLMGLDRQVNRVSYNISQEADNFNVIRRLTVLNARTDKPLFELVAAFSFTLENNRIVAICETGPNEYKKHSVGLNEWTLWVVEDVSGADVNRFHYEVNFLPEMIIPITFISED